MQVAALVWEGQTNREIARAIGTTEQVVKNYLRNTFDKLGVWSRLELAIYVARHGGERWQEELAMRPREVLSATIASSADSPGPGGLVRHLRNRQKCQTSLSRDMAKPWLPSASYFAAVEPPAQAKLGWGPSILIF
ncbi:MAG: response regulator transcription factor [Terriglobales bacterium]